MTKVVQHCRLTNFIRISHYWTISFALFVKQLLVDVIDPEEILS